ncbi:MAG: CsbD family protein [Roseivivax sp.]|nr:CsbD family protein [Roseivivax sp.]
MNWDQVEGQWKQIKGRVLEQWGELTGDEVDRVNGNREQLEGLLQEKYGKTKEEVRDDINRWLDAA